MTQPTHSVRRHMFSREESYILRADALVVQGGPQEKRIPYGDVASVRLISYIGDDGPQEQCTIVTRSDGKLVVRSHHFVSAANFEDRSATYAPFVRDLCRRVDEASESARFVQGSAGLQAGWLIVLGLAAIGWVIWAAAVYEGAVGIWQAASVLVVLALGTIIGAYAVRGNAVREFDPRNPPLG